MKKTITLILVFAMCAALGLPAMAIDNSSYIPDNLLENTATNQDISYIASSTLNIPESMPAKLIDESGNQVEITGVLQDTCAVLSTYENDDRDLAVTYEYTVRASDLNHTHTVDGTDSTGYMRAYFTLYYRENTSLEPHEYLLTGGMAEWEDPNTMDGTKPDTTGTMILVCRGIGQTGIYKKQAIDKEVTSGQVITTGFQYSIINDLGVMGGSITIGISQGINRHWDLFIEAWPIDAI